ncbi:Ig-like domain-containing protein, partial [Jiulongibacter sediminis]
MKAEEIRNSVTVRLKTRLSAWLLLFLCLSFLSNSVNAQTELIPVGSRIVDMGVEPQTINNGLKPYGLVYALVDRGIPVLWSINPSKSFGEPDFYYEGKAYKGGTFIIPSPITPKTDSIITAWQAQGVVISTPTTSLFSAPIYLSLKIAPNMVLDAQNGKIAKAIFEEAGINASKYYFMDPQLLSSCEDVFLMPHADPKWSTHSNLYNWNLTHKGAIWLGCHAGSALENTFNPSNPAEQMNFLAEKTGIATGSGPWAASPGNSLLLWSNHDDGSPPYKKAYPEEPVMQFIGSPDDAMQNGSEQIYLPVNGGGWRTSTKIGVWDDTQDDVPSKSPGKAAAIAFGQAFGDPNRGKVMYEGGHNIGGSSPENIAAQRAMINFVIWAGQDKAFTIDINAPVKAIGGSVISLNATINATPSGPYTYTWSTECGGSFSNASGTFTNPGDAALATATDFTLPNAPTQSFPCIITLQITDACNRKVSEASYLLVESLPQPPTAINDYKTILPGTTATVYPLDNDSDPNMDTLNFSGLLGNLVTDNGEFKIQSYNRVLYSPNIGFEGVDSIAYEVCDPGGLCDTAYIYITVGDVPDACGDGLTSKRVGQGNAISYSGLSGVSNPERALGETDSQYATINLSGGQFLLDLGENLNPGDTITLRLASRTLGGLPGQHSIFQIEGASSPISSFSGSSVIINTPSTALQNYNYFVTASDTRYLLINNTSTYSDGYFESAYFNVYKCVPNCNEYEISTTAWRYATSVFSESGVSTPSNIIGAFDGSYSEFSSGDQMILDLGYEVPEGTVLQIKMKLNGTPSITNKIDISSSASTSGFSGSSTFTVTSNDSYSNFYYTTPSGVKRYLLINNLSGDKNIRIDGVKYFYVNCLSARPEAVNDTIILCEDNIIDFLPTRNDQDPAGRELTLSVLESPSNGVVKKGSNNWLTYVPDVDFKGSDTIQYRICNDLGLCSSAFVFLNITPDVCSVNYYSPATIDTLSTGNISAIEDNYIDQDPTHITFNYGVDNKLKVQSTSGKVKRSLVKFDLPDIPATAVVYKAYLKLNKTGGDAGVSVSAHQILSDWIEGGVNGIAGESNWTKRDVGIDWTSPGGDYNTSQSSFITSGSNGIHTWDVTNIVSNWLNDGDLNLGFLIKITNEAVSNSIDFASREDVGNEPALVIEYILPTTCSGACVQVPNRPPVAIDDEECTEYNQSLTYFVAANDRDPNKNLDSTSVIILNIGGYPKYGSAIVNLDGSITYTPDSGSISPDSLYYSISDSGSPALSDTALFKICIQPIPVFAYDDYDTTLSGVPVTVDVTINDIDPSGGILSISIDPDSPPRNGSFTLDSNKITYTPFAGFTGLETFKYILCNDEFPPMCDTATVAILVENRPPEPVNDTLRTEACYPYTIDVLANDSDPEGHSFEIVSVTQPTPSTVGEASFNSSYITFSPNGTAGGTYYINYTVVDDGNTPKTATGTVVLIISPPPPPNNSPIAINDTLEGNQGSPIYFNVKDNDYEPDNHLFNVIKAGAPDLTAPSNGSVSILDNELIRYQPSPTFSGITSFEYQICDSVPVPAGCPTISRLCATATVVAIVVPLDVYPFTEKDTIESKVGGIVLNNIAQNDLISGNPAVLGISGNASVSEVGIWPSGISLNSSNGDIYVVPGTIPGIYPVSYKLCDTMDPANCAVMNDTVVVIQIIKSDTISLTVNPNDGDTLCPTADDIFSIQSIDINYCTGPLSMGSVSVDSTGCAVFTAFDNAPGGTDTLCVVGIDSLGRRDTTVFLVTVPPDLIQPDTILVTIQPNDADTLCPTADDIYGIDAIDIELCAGPLTMGSISTDSAGCAIYSAFDNTPGGTDTLCVIATDSLGRKDTTVFLVTVPADIIQPDTILVTIQPNDADTLCPTADDIYGIEAIDIELCAGPLTMGSISTDSAGCAIYSAFDNAPGGTDTLCVIATDSLGRKDTTVFLITVPADIIQPDTILVTIQPNDA